MARAIIREPRVFLFDEPLSNLDATLRVRMRHEIRRIHDRIGATCVFVTHDQQEGMTLADRLVVMNKGTIEQVGTPEDIYERPASVYVGGFIGSPAMNFLPAEIAGADLVLGNGVRLRIPGLAGRDGMMVMAGLRPERLTLTGPGLGQISARVDFVEEFGSARLVHVLVEDIALSVLTTDKFALTPGDDVGIAIGPGVIQLFDGTTGKRIETDVPAALQHEPAS
jgi:sn-glycerol 3-phosphate transport system ATP-binding protein